MRTLGDGQNQANLRPKLGDRPIRSTVYSRVAAGVVFHARLFSQADDAGADGSANGPRPLCGLLLDLAKPQVHAAPSAPASSAMTYRKHFDEWVFECFSNFYMFKGSSRRFYCLCSYINSSDLGVGKCFYFTRMAGGLAGLRASHCRLQAAPGCAG